MIRAGHKHAWERHYEQDGAPSTYERGSMIRAGLLARMGEAV
jgi:hypothetical protein